jgi:hypothetical protein
MSEEAKAWDTFCDQLRATGHAVLDAAPDDPFDRAEGLRYVTRLATHFLRSTIETSDPGGARLSTESPKIGLDNPDYVYCGARLSGKFEYRLRGNMGDASLLGIGAYSGGLGTPQGLVRDGYLSSEELELEPDGRFEIAVSVEPRPGNWLPMTERTNSLNIRQTLLERHRQQPAPIELVRIDAGEAPRPLDPERFLGGLARTGGMVAGVVGQFLGWTESFRTHLHEIRPIDPALLSVAQGDPNTQYNYSYWELEPDEAFVIELEPPECEYWNLQIGNHWLESLDFLHHRTHVNQHTAVLDSGGTVRIVVAQQDPGVPNWLDTAGHRRGTLALRFVGADSTPTPRTRLVRLPDLA